MTEDSLAVTSPVAPPLVLGEQDADRFVADVPGLLSAALAPAPATATPDHEENA